MEKPTKNFNYWTKQEGNFDILHPQDKEVQYKFHLRPDAPKEIKRYFLLSLDKDEQYMSTSGSALDIAYELKQAIDSHWLNTDKGKIEELIEYLEQQQEQDEKEEMEYELAHAQFEVGKWQEKYETLNKQYQKYYGKETE